MPKGEKSKFQANLAAIGLLKQLEAENRPATPQEQAVLSKYTGWGALANAFNEGHAESLARLERGDYVSREKRDAALAWQKAWGKEYLELKGLLTPDEWLSAMKSTVNSHYTSRTLVNGIWQAVQRMGFKGGRVLEPAVGTGNFIGLTPPDLRGRIRWSAVELDSLTSRMAQKLYPGANHINAGFEAARIPWNSQDLVISNVPFNKDGPKDARYPDMSLHNYFFARAMDLARPGGVVAFITSMSTMDAPVSKVLRDLLKDRADLVGALRLPDDAFKENAGTQVTTDVLFLRKRDAHAFPVTPWQGLTEIQTAGGDKLAINEYFARQPDMMLGTLALADGHYGQEREPALKPSGAPLEQQLQDAIAKLPTDVFRPKVDGEQKAIDSVMVPMTFKQGRLEELQGKFGTTTGDGQFEAVEWQGDAARVEQARRYVKMRGTVLGLIEAMRRPETTDTDLEQQRAQLNREYDDYVKRHGAVNEANSSYLDVDVDFPLMMALEVEDVTLAAGGLRRKIVWRKSDIFTKRTIVPLRPPPERLDRVPDAINVSLNYLNRLDVDYVAKLVGRPVEDVQQELRATGQAFEDPATGQWQLPEEYLTGLVRDKLKTARAAAEVDDGYAVNVEALSKALPQDIPLDQVRFGLGSTWVPAPVVEAFVRSVLDARAKVEYVPATGQWMLKTTQSSYANANKYGVHGLTGTELVERSLNLKQPVVYVGTGDERVKSDSKTLEAIDMQRQVNEAFQTFAQQNPDANRLLTQSYNQTFNTLVPPTYRAPEWKYYPGASSAKELRPHQKQVVSRMLRNSVLMAHAVGAGKTFAMITGAMEMRRLGLAKKPMIVVQSATLEQFPRDFKTLYPNARLLVPNKKMREGAYRNATMSRIATGDYDAVIVPHTWFERMPDSLDRQRRYIQEEIDNLKQTITRAGGDAKSPTVKALAKAITKLEAQLGEISHERQQDNVLTFEQLGVDALFVDEAHRYKGLPFATKMARIKGLAVERADRASSLYMKARYVQELNGGRNVVLATGTPVSNSVSELHTMLRYVRPDLLDKYGIKLFDAFATTFTAPQTLPEPTATGDLQFITRLSSFQNGPELLAAWLTAADVIIPEQIKFDKMPVLKTGATMANSLPATPRLEAYIQELRQELLDWQALSPKERHEKSYVPLVVQSKARKAALDMRMIDANLPAEPGSKLLVAADKIATIWRDSTPVRGTQMVFSDSVHDTAVGSRFDLYQELKDQLVQRGIPAEQILIVNEDLTDAKRDVAFRKLNEAEVRVAIGHSERMGVGVNAQKHMIALHHLDPPWKPMYVEQRNGRILRQNNMNAEVEIHSYGVEGTVDAAMYSLLERKQRFINQLLRGQMQGRHFEDPAGDAALSFQAQLAAYSGDKRLLEVVDLQQKIKNWQVLQAAHNRRIREAHESIPRLQKVRAAWTEALERATARAAQITAAFAPGRDLVLTQAQPGGAVLTKTGRAEIGQWLNKVVPEELARLAAHGGWVTPAAARHRYQKPSALQGLSLNGIPLTLDATASYRQGRTPQEGAFENIEFLYELADRRALTMERVGQESPTSGAFRTGAGLLQSLETVLQKIADHPAKVQLDIAQADRDILTAQQAAGDFPQQTALADALARLQALQSDLENEAKRNTLERHKRQTGMQDDDGVEEMRLDFLGDRGLVAAAVNDVKRLQRLVAPQTQGATAREVGNLLRERTADMAAELARADVALKKFRAQFDRTQVPKDWTYDPTVPLPRNYAFIDAYERGNRGQLLAMGDGQLADALHKMNRRDVRRVRALGTGALETYYRHYFPHIWDNPKAAAQMMERILAKRPLQGPATFLKERTHEFFEAGLRHGLRPVHDNPIDLWLLKKREVERFILGHRAVNELKERGLLKFKYVFGRTPDGYAPVDDRAFQVYGPPTVTVQEAFDATLRSNLLELMKDLGVPHERLVKTGGKDRWGYMAYKPGVPDSERIVTKFGGPDFVLVHELGHVLGIRYRDFRKSMEATDAMKDEVKKLAMLRTDPKITNPGFAKYVLNAREREAVILQAYLYAPELMSKEAPTVKRALERFIDRHPELARLKDIRPSLRLESGSAEVPHNGLLKLGEYVLPAQAARVFENYLSPGLNSHAWYRSIREVGNLLNGVQLGLSAFHLGFTSLDAVVSRLSVAARDLSQGKVGRAALTALSLPISPVTTALRGHRLRAEVLQPGTHVELEAVRKALIKSGGRVAMDHFWQTNFTRRMKRAWHAGGAQLGTALGLAPFAAWEQTMRPILEWVVPRQKLGVFYDMARRDLERLGPEPDPTSAAWQSPADYRRAKLDYEAKVREVGRQAWDSTDNRMGQVVYDNLFYNRVVKDVALLAFRAYGWQLGKYREGVGAMLDTVNQGRQAAAWVSNKAGLPKVAQAVAPQNPTPLELTHRQAYAVSLFLAVGTVGALVHYLFTGRHPDELRDYFQPKTGETDRNGNPVRVNLPSYVKDVLHYAKHPGDSFINSLHPVWHAMAELLGNRDYFDVQIRNPDDPLYRQAGDVLKYAGAQFVPFSVSGALKLKEEGSPAWKLWSPYVGITPVPLRMTMSPAQELASEIMAGFMPSAPRTREDMEESQLLKALVDDLKRGQVDPGQADSTRRFLAENGARLAETLTPERMVVLAKHVGYTPLQFQVHMMPAEYALKVWRIATPDERRLLVPILASKLGRTRDPKALKAAMEMLGVP